MKIVIEKHIDGYCGYPIDFAGGAIVGQGDTYIEAIQSTENAIKAFIEYFGFEKFKAHFEHNEEIQDAFIAEAEVF